MTTSTRAQFNMLDFNTIVYSEENNCWCLWNGGLRLSKCESKDRVEVNWSLSEEALTWWWCAFVFSSGLDGTRKSLVVHRAVFFNNQWTCGLYNSKGSSCVGIAKHTHFALGEYTSFNVHRHSDIAHSKCSWSVWWRITESTYFSRSNSPRIRFFRPVVEYKWSDWTWTRTISTIESYRPHVASFKVILSDRTMKCSSKICVMSPFLIMDGEQCFWIVFTSEVRPGKVFPGMYSSTTLRKRKKERKNHEVLLWQDPDGGHWEEVALAELPFTLCITSFCIVFVFAHVFVFKGHPSTSKRKNDLGNMFDKIRVGFFSVTSSVLPNYKPSLDGPTVWSLTKRDRETCSNGTTWIPNLVLSSPSSASRAPSLGNRTQHRLMLGMRSIWLCEARPRYSWLHTDIFMSFDTIIFCWVGCDGFLVGTWKKSSSSFMLYIFLQPLSSVYKHWKKREVCASLSKNVFEVDGVHSAFGDKTRW